jgi:endonuclease YncB( thermonuclease family)
VRPTREHTGGMHGIRLWILLFAIVLLQPHLSDGTWASSSRMALYGRAGVVSVESANLVTLKIIGNGKVVSARLVGVGSPLNRDRRRGLDRHVINFIDRNEVWEQSKNYVQSLIRNRTVEVWVRRDGWYDEKNRLLAYLVIPSAKVDSVDVNAEIIKNGLGFVTRDFLHVTYAEYKRFEDEARKYRRGLWRCLSQMADNR